MKNATISVMTASRSLLYHLLCAGILEKTVYCGETFMTDRCNGFFNSCALVLGEESTRTLFDKVTNDTRLLAYTRLLHWGTHRNNGTHASLHHGQYACEVKDAWWPVTMDCLDELAGRGTSKEYVYVYIEQGAFSHLFEIAPYRQTRKG